MLKSAREPTHIYGAGVTHEENTSRHAWSRKLTLQVNKRAAVLKMCQVLQDIHCDIVVRL